jgi:hypothetical protein
MKMMKKLFQCCRTTSDSETTCSRKREKNGKVFLIRRFRDVNIKLGSESEACVGVRLFPFRKEGATKKISRIALDVSS